MKKICLSLVLILALAGCNKDQNANLVLGELIPLSLNGVTTKAPVNLEATTVGAYVLQTDAMPASTLLNAPFMNLLYNVDAQGLFSAASDTKLNNTGKYAVTGYAPYKTVTDVNAVPFNGNEDVLYAPPAPVTFTANSASASLKFVHKMAQISFVIVPGANNPDITGATLSATGFYESCTLNLNDGTLTPVMGNGAVISQTNKVFYIVPGNLNLDLSVTIGSKVYKTIKPYLAEEGKSCVYTLKVNESSSAELSIDIQLVDWNVIDAGNLPDSN